MTDVAPGSTFTTDTSPIASSLIGQIGYRILQIATNTFGVRVTAGITEAPVGDGLSIYSAVPTAPLTEGDILVVWDDGSVPASYATDPFNVTSHSSSDPLAALVPGSYGPGTAGNALGRLQSTAITVQAYQHQNGLNLEIIVGDDYNVGEVRGFVFHNDTWPVLTGAAVKANMRHRTLPKTALFPLTIVDANTVRLELTHAETIGLTKGSYNYSLEAVLANGRDITLGLGTATVIDPP